MYIVWNKTDCKYALEGVLRGGKLIYRYIPVFLSKKGAQNWVARNSALNEDTEYIITKVYDRDSELIAER
jgi:hypothetical protein